MTKLSQREKILLIVLILLVINYAGITYLIIPGYNHLAASRSNLKQLQTEYTQEKQIVDQKDQYQTAYQQALAEYQASPDHFFTFASAEEMDKYLNNLLSDIDDEYAAAFSIDDSSTDTLAGGNVMASRIEIDGSGSYQTLLTVIDRLNSSAEYMAVVQWDLGQYGSQWQLSASIVMYRYYQTSGV